MSFAAKADSVEENLVEIVQIENVEFAKLPLIAEDFLDTYFVYTDPISSTMAGFS